MSHQYTHVNDVSEIRRFIVDLKEALKRAEQTGGGYSAFLHDENGDVIFQLEIAPLVRGKK